MADQPWLVSHLLATIRCFENPKLPGFCQEVVGQILSLKVSLAVAFLPLASHRSLDFQSEENVALLALVRGANFEQLVNAFYHFKHDPLLR